MEILQFWRVIRQRLGLVISITVVVVLVTGLASFFVLKPKYEATATLLVQNQKENNQQQMYNDLLANQQLVKTYSDIIKSKKIADDVIQRLSLNISEADLLNKVAVQTTTQSLVTSITVTDNDPKQAVEIANGFAQSFKDNVNQIMKVDNVSILDTATMADSAKPVSPKKTMNMAIAFILGILVSVGLVFLLESLDKTIKTEEEIAELLDLPVLGVIARVDGDKKQSKKTKKSMANRGVTSES